MLVAATLIPFILLLFIIFVLHRSLSLSAALAFAVALLLWYQVPTAGPAVITVAVWKAFFLSIEVSLILLGAMAFLDYMQHRGTTENIKKTLMWFTQGDLGLVALMLAWLFCAFLEGVAGFGAPAALIAPLLVSLGFNPLMAAVLPLIGDSAAVLFGAVGTPIRIGLAHLPAEHAAVYGASINAVAGLVAPLAIYYFVVRQDRQHAARRSPARAYLLAAWAGLCFVGPAWVFSWIGPEFPSIGGSLVGILLFSLTLLLLRSRSPRPKTSEDTAMPNPLKQLIRAFFPYLLLCVLLLLGKIILGRSAVVFEIGGQEQSLAWFQPGLIFLLACGLVALWSRDIAWPQFFKMIPRAAKNLPSVWITIFCLVGLAQMLMRGGGLAGVAASLAQFDELERLLVTLAPLTGTLGAFIAGSATVSNLIMGPLLVQGAQDLAVNMGLILGLQLAGAGAGNMIALQNIAAVQATVGLHGREREMLQLLWKPCAVYVLLAIGVGHVLLGLLG